MSSPALADVAIVGAGFSGCLAAIALGRAGHSVTLVDVHSANQALFRAEKISGDQLPLLQELGLFDDFKAVATPVAQFINIRGKHVIDRPAVEEYGLLYPAMLELLRGKLPPTVLFRHGHVLDIHPSDSVQRVVLANDEMLSARLVLLATGYGGGLRKRLGFKSRKMSSQPTACIGFTLKPPASGFRFPALAAYGERCGDGVDYVGIFPLGELMRANMFMFSHIRDPRIQSLRNNGLPALFDILPGLQSWLHDCEFVSDIAVFPVELYKCDNPVRDGIVLIGDAFRTSCPAVGSGLSCALTDVVQLRHHVSEWLKTPGMQATKIASFYSDPLKVARDDSAYQFAFQRRDKVTKTSLTHKLRLNAHYAKRRLRDRLCSF